MKPATYVYYATITVLLLLCVLFYMHFRNGQESFEGGGERKVGFILTRHVNSEKSNRLWKTCVSRIREHYPTTPIIIIDDNSNYEFVTETDINLDNCTVIDSEFKKSGELLPYYYFYKHHWFDRAIYIHDSVMLHNTIPHETVQDVKFLWHFKGGEHEDSARIERLLHSLNHNSELLALFQNKSKWNGCWGAMSVIDYDYLQRIMEKYNLANLLNEVKCREDRMAFERIFGLISCAEKPELLQDPGIFGYYAHNQNNRNSSSYSYDDYLEDVGKGTMKCPANKLFLGR